jgi:ABC-type transport system substrate-binding protein
VRRAISISQNRRDAVDVLGEGQGGVGGYMMAGGVWSLGENDLKQVPGYGPQDDKAIAEAKQLLSAAGMPANMDVQILTRQGATYERLSVFIADGMKKVGINARPRVVETAAAYVDLESRNFDLAPWSHATALDDPDAIYAEFYLTNSPRNYSDLGTAEVDALYLRQSQTLNQQERVKLVHEMEKKALPLYGKIILNWSMRNWARWSHVENYTPHVGIYNHNRLAEVWLDQR